MAERCTNPTCLDHWPVVSTEPVHLSLHTAPPPVPDRSTGYPRRDDIHWTKGEAITTTWSPNTDPLDDGDPDE